MNTSKFSSSVAAYHEEKFHTTIVNILSEIMMEWLGKAYGLNMETL
jgi:hypothetical protein